MAALSEINAITQRHFMPILTNQIFLNSPVLQRIFKGSKEGQWGLAIPSTSGRSIVEPLESAEALDKSDATQVGAYNKTTVWTAGEAEAISGAEFNWKLYHATLAIHNLDIAENTGRERVIDIAAAKIRNAAKTLQTILITDFYGTSLGAGDKMIGMQGITALTGTLGGIDKAANLFWRGVELDNSGTPRDLTWALLNEMYYLTKRFGNHDKATLIVTSEAVLHAYEERLNKVVPTNLPTSGPAAQKEGVYRTAPLGGRIVIDGGFEGFMFKGIPMVADPFLADLTGFSTDLDNRLFFINENHVNWRVLKNFESTGWQQLKLLGRDKLQMTINGYGALTTNAPRKQGLIKDLIETASLEVIAS